MIKHKLQKRDSGYEASGDLSNALCRIDSLPITASIVLAPTQRHSGAYTRVACSVGEAIQFQLRARPDGEMKKKDSDKMTEKILPLSRSVEHRTPPEVKARPERRGLEHRPRSVLLMDSADTWSTPHMAQAIARMAESGRAKVKELLARHSELEQSETKAQGALVTILSLTQITELKLLLDIGRMGHRFYDFVLTLLIACISLEIFVGMIIIYIGNLHYYQASTRGGWCYDILSCLFCCCRPCRWPKRNGIYLSVGSATGGREPLQRGHPGSAHHDEDDGGGCCEWPAEPRVETLIDLERADSNIEVARVKVADADVKIVRANNYVKVVEDALKRTPGNPDLEEELTKARDELSSALREKEEAEAEQKLAEAQQHHAFFVKEQHEDRQERITFRKVSFWQHMATYLLYFVMLMNVFITTFGISGGKYGTVINTDNFHTGNGTHR